MNVVLFGFMGVGKTTVGRLLSEEMGYRFIDVDEEITRTTQREIRAIFESDGEEAFREIERRAIRTISNGDKQVIACGGGAVLDPENVDNLKEKSLLVLLTASLDEIMLRTSNDISRPLLNVADRRETAKKILCSRIPQYLKIADMCIDTTSMTPEQVADKITERLEEAC